MSQAWKMLLYKGGTAREARVRSSKHGAHDKHLPFLDRGQYSFLYKKFDNF
jgi:hypothetical protein